MNVKKRAEDYEYGFQTCSRMEKLVLKPATVLASKVALLVPKHH